MAEKHETMYRATEPLFLGRARAHNPGDLVPAKYVEKHGWQDKVEALKPGNTPAAGAGAVVGAASNRVDDILKAELGL